MIAAVATGKAPCAIGILRLSGAGCAAVADRVFTLDRGGSLEDAPNRKLLLGRLYDRFGRMIDQAMAVYCRAPHSYTGEDTVELQCHGSPAMLAAGLEALLAAGARQALPGEFTKRAFLNGQLDLTQAEAVIDLIDAETADAAANAAGQLGGAMLRRIDPNGKPCLTEYRVLERSNSTSKLELHPVTGRTHQLRLHCAYLGCPILGDPQYGTEESSAYSARLGIQTQLLCAKRLEFTHPLTGERITLDSKMTIL